MLRSPPASSPTVQMPFWVERLHGRRQPADDRHPQMFDGTRRGLGHGRRDVRGAMARQNHTRHTRALRCPQDRAEVARIGDAVEQEQERQRAVALWVEQVLQRCRAERLGHGEHALGAVGAGHRLELAARDLAQRDLLFVGEIDDVVEDRGVIEIAGEDHLARAAGPGHEQLADRVAPLDLVAAEMRSPATLVGGADGGGPPLAVAPTRTGTATPGVARALAASLRRLLGRGAAPSALGTAVSGASVRTAPAHRTIRATAHAAIPSPRPRAPTPSVRRPVTVTGAPAASDRLVCI